MRHSKIYQMRQIKYAKNLMIRSYFLLQFRMKMSKMLLSSFDFGCGEEVLSLAAMLSVQVLGCCSVVVL